MVVYFFNGNMYGNAGSRIIMGLQNFQGALITVDHVRNAIIEVPHVIPEIL